MQINDRGDGIWHDLDFEKYPATAVYNVFKSGVCSTLPNYENESILKQIVAGIKLDREDNENFTLSPKFVQSLTINQLDKLKSLDSWFATDDNFIGARFQKQFCEDLSAENQEAFSLEENLENLIRLYDLAKSQDLPKEFQRQFIEEILSVGPKCGVFSKDHFIQYLDILNKKDVSIF